MFELGARNFDLYGDRPGKFLEFRDVVRGVYVKGLDIRLESADSPTLFHIRGTNIRELDERIEADFWQVRRLRTTFLWDRLPHFYSDGTSLFQSDNRGNFTVSPAIRAAFQAAVDGQTPQNVNPALNPLVRAELAKAPASDLRIRGNEVSLRLSIRLGRFELHGRWKSIFSSGSRPKGIGTFARQNIGPGTQPDGLWESIGVEVPEPVRHRTGQLTLGGLLS